MAEPFLGQISTFGFNFAPRGWASCDGRILSIAQNTALFSLLGTTYGGNGQTTFALPDLRGRVSVNQGQGPGLTNYVIGETGGVENVSLISTQIPAHNHVIQINANNAPQTGTADPLNAVPAGGSGQNVFAADTDGTTLMNVKMATCGMAGGSQPHENLQPLLCINVCIALQGVFPSRN